MAWMPITVSSQMKQMPKRWTKTRLLIMLKVHLWMHSSNYTFVWRRKEPKCRHEICKLKWKKNFVAFNDDQMYGVVQTIAEDRKSAWKKENLKKKRTQNIREKKNRTVTLKCSNNRRKNRKMNRNIEVDCKVWEWQWNEQHDTKLMHTPFKTLHGAFTFSFRFFFLFECALKSLVATKEHSP